MYSAVRAGRGVAASVAVYVSENGGRTFEETARMRPGSGILNAVSDLEVLRDGTAVLPHVAFSMEARGKEVARARQTVLRSRDGGRTSGEGRRISKRETCLPSGYRWQNGGDTQGLVTLPDGSFRTVWTGPGPHGPRPWTAVFEPR